MKRSLLIGSTVLALLHTGQHGYPRSADSDHNGAARCDIGAYETELQQFLPLVRR